VLDVSTAIIFACALAAVPYAVARDVISKDVGGSIDGSRQRATQALTAYGQLPLLFERRVGAGGDVRFIGHGAARGVGITARGFRLAAPSAATDPDSSVAFEFVNSSPMARVEGADAQQTLLHRFGADAAAQQLDLPTYARVRVLDAYPGVDIVFYGQRNRVEYDVIVAPGGDPRTFGLRVDDAVSLDVDADGNLVATRGGHAVKLQRPAAYQVIDGVVVRVDSDFDLASRQHVRVRVGAYDAAHPLVIDPVISYATYVGGGSFEQGTAIAVDASGSAYIAGYTLSNDFPTVSAYDRSIGRSGDVDVFVSKLNAAGTALVWSTYIGMAGSVERAVGIAVDAAGSAYVTGQTATSTYPVTAGAWQKGSAAGGSFVTKLSPQGNALVYSTYVAGATTDAIAVDAGGSAYVTGTASPALVTTPASLQPAPKGAAGTGFVLRLNADGSAPVYSTFVGGSGSDEATSIAIDGRGNAFIGGWTTSADFPLVNPIPQAAAGQKDAFIAKLDATGSKLIYSTRLGGTLDDAVNAIAIDGDGRAYVVGETYSSDFPTKSAFQPLKAGSRLINSSVGSAFVAKLAPAGDALVYASFLGGEVCLTLCQLIFGPQPQFRADAAYGVAVDTTGHAYVSGIARSYTFPLVDSTAVAKKSDSDDSAFVAKVGASGSTLLWSTFVRTGFNGSDNHWTRFPPGAATGIAVDAAGAIYVTGDADTSSTFRPSAGAFQTAISQGATVVKFAASPRLTLATSNPGVDVQTPITLTATLAGAGTTGDVVFMDGNAWIGSATLTGTTATLTTTLPAGIHPLTAVLRLPGIAADTPIVYQVVEPSLACD
jgi:hypothetical protein